MTCWLAFLLVYGQVVFDAVDDVGYDDLGFYEVVVDAEAFSAGFVAWLSKFR